MIFTFLVILGYFGQFQDFRGFEGVVGGEDGGWWLGCQNARCFYDKKSPLSV